MESKALDAAALELAQISLAEEPDLSDRAEELAECIRDVIEDWVAEAKEQLGEPQAEETGH